MRITKTNDLKKNYWEDNFTDESAAVYMETYGEGTGSPLRLKLASYLKLEEWVLDVGCGPGWNFDTFMNIVSVYYRGIDYSSRFVKVANRRTGLNIFKVGDVRNIPEGNKSFDVVILQDVLEHTNGYEKPLKEALRVAKRLIIVTFWHLAETDDPHINDDGSDTYGAWYDKNDWESFLNKNELSWSHEQIPRKDTLHDIYLIEVI